MTDQAVLVDLERTIRRLRLALEQIEEMDEDVVWPAARVIAGAALGA